MKTLILSQSEIRRLLPMDVCIDLMANALATLGRDEARNPLRWGVNLGEGASIGMMPGQMSSPSSLGLKIIGIFPGNHGTEYDSHQGIVLLLHPEHGTPIAIFDASEITAIRTAAVSGLATRLLAREDAKDLAILGSGVQARTHLEAMLCVRKIEQVRVWSPSRRNREKFVSAAAVRHGVRVAAVHSAQEAVRDADIVCTTTSAREPIVSGEWLAPGCHVNAVGSSEPDARELDAEAIRRSRLYTDRRESIFAEGGDFLLARVEGAVTDEHVLGEIGEILLGEIEGRTAPDQITQFKSLGLAVEDLASAHYLLQRAREEGAGTEVVLGDLQGT